MSATTTIKLTAEEKYILFHLCNTVKEALVESVFDNEKCFVDNGNICIALNTEDYNALISAHKKL